MKDIFSVLKDRRSCRRFKDSPITKDDLLLLVEYAIMAPSPSNIQDYRFIVSLSREKLMALPDACMEQDWISQAGGVIVVCSQPEVIKEFFPEHASELGRQSASAAAQNILLAAHGLGFGACWVGGFVHNMVRDIFDIPEDVQIEAIIPVGHPYGEPDPKTSRDISTMVYFDAFGNDKQDMVLRHKDYSVRIEQQMHSASKAADRYKKRGKELGKKMKEFFLKDD